MEGIGMADSIVSTTEPMPSDTSRSVETGPYALSVKQRRARMEASRIRSCRCSERKIESCRRRLTGYGFVFMKNPSVMTAPYGIGGGRRGAGGGGGAGGADGAD